MSRLKQTCNQDCKLKCCLSCTFCNRAVGKQRHKTQSEPNRNKVCETCLLCKSLSLCSNCSKCPSCCTKSTCGGPTAKVLAGLALPGCKQKSSFNSSGRVHPTLQRETSPDKVTGNYQWIRKSGQKQAHKGLLTGTPSETGGRKGDNSVLPGLLQPLVSSTKTQQPMEAHPRSKSAELLPSNLIFQDGDTRDHPTLPSKRGVGDVSGFQRRLLPYPNRTKVAEIPQILPPQSSLSVHSPPLWPLNGSVGVHKGGQGSQVNGTGSGYQNPPVPRRLVAESPMPGNVPTSYPDPLGPMPQVRVGSQYDQVGVGASAGLQLCRLPFRPLSGVGQTDPGEVDGSVPKDQQPPQSTGVSGPTVHVSYRTANSHRETGSSRAASHAPYPVASEEALACPGVIGKDYPSASVPSSTPEVVVEPKQCPKRSAFTPTSTRSSAVYRRLKRRLGCSLRRFHSKRPLVHTRKRLAYKLAGTQGRPASPKTVRAIVLEPDHSGVFRQHNSGLLHKQGGRYEIRLSLCSPLEAADVVQPEADCIKSTAYSGSPQCHCGQVVPARSGDTNGMVPPAGSLRPNLQKMAVDALSVPWQDLDAYVFPPVALLGKVVAKLMDQGFNRIILIAPGWPNMPWFWDLVSMSVQIPLSLPRVGNLLTQPFNQCPHRDLHSLNLHAWLLGPLPSNRQASLKKWQHELKLLRDVQPEPSTNQSGPFLSDGVRNIRWTSGLLL